MESNLIIVVKQSNIRSINNFLKQYLVNVDEINQAIYIAEQKNQNDIVNLLKEYYHLLISPLDGIFPLYIDSMRTNLMVISARGYIQILKIKKLEELVLNYQDIYGKTALHYALSQIDNFPITSLLIEHGANVKIVDYNNLTPMNQIIDYMNSGNDNEREIYTYLVKKFSPEYFTGLYTDPVMMTPSVCQLVTMLTKKFDGMIIVNREILESYAELFKIEILDQTDDELAKQIQTVAPCNWINSVLEWAKKHSKFSNALNKYVTDIMMEILHNIRDGKSLNYQEKQLLQDINSAIWNSPRPNTPFKVYRGYHGSIDDPIPLGNFITFNTPKSASFDLHTIINYVDENGCCISEILIPPNSVVSYHPSEDQIIFPAGAQFVVLTDQEHREFRSGYDAYVSTIIYIGVNNIDSGYLQSGYLDSGYLVPQDLQSGDLQSKFWEGKVQFPLNI